MFKNYLASFWRNIAHNPFYSIINMLGLVIGMTTFLLLMQYVMHEYSYDKFLKNADRIFRVEQDRYDNGVLSTQWASGCAGVGPAMKANFPEVEEYVRMRQDGAIFSNGKETFKEDEIFFATKNFFDVFSIPLLEGNDTTALKDPFAMVLSQSMAKKYFHGDDPVGKTLIANGGRSVKITGVFKDLPENTHMKFDALLSFSTYQSFFKDPDALNTWNWDGFMTYIKLTKNTDPEALTAKFPAFIKKVRGDNYDPQHPNIVFHLQPVRNIHLDSNYMFEFQRNGNRATVRYLAIIAILIMIIAWINYINLSTAKSVERSREVGIRKVMGGVRWELIRQFMMESIIVNIITIALSVLCVAILTPAFSKISGRELHYFIFHQPVFWIGLVLMIITGSLLTGLYPAFILSGFKPISVLKGRSKNTSQGIQLRKGLVVLQFTVSIALITGTFVVYRQVRFLQNQSLGININQTLVINSPGITDSTYQQKYQVFKHRLLKYPEVASVTASTEVPGRQPGWNAGGIRLLSQSDKESKQYRVIMMDGDFIPAYGLKTIAGRAFSDDKTGEDKNVMMNEAASKLMGFNKPEDALNEQIFFWGDTFNIVGVVKNYGQESLKKSYDPMIFRYSDAPGGYYSIKFNTSKVKNSMAAFRKDWDEIFPGNPYDYFFLDDRYNAQYKADEQFGTVFGIFSSLAIFIACLGLIGLTSLSVMQRTKEIGIRKVMGAGVSSIVSLMSKEYFVLLGISVFLSIPAAGWAMSRWLQAFAHRITLSWWVFAIPCLVVLLIAFLAVSYHTLKAATTDPVKTLRYE